MDWCFEYCQLWNGWERTTYPKAHRVFYSGCQVNHVAYSNSLSIYLDKFCLFYAISEFCCQTTCFVAVVIVNYLLSKRLMSSLWQLYYLTLSSHEVLHYVFSKQSAYNNKKPLSQFFGSATWTLFFLSTLYRVDSLVTEIINILFLIISIHVCSGLSSPHCFVNNVMWNVIRVNQKSVI